MPNLIIGSRGSKLALWQSNWIKEQLERLHPGVVIEIEIIKTTGDKLTEASLTKIAGKGEGLAAQDTVRPLQSRPCGRNARSASGWLINTLPVEKKGPAFRGLLMSGIAKRGALRHV